MTSQIGTAAPCAHRDELTLDRRVIADFGNPAAGVSGFVVALIRQFIEEAGAQVEELQEAGRRLDARAVRAIAHSLRGSSDTMGARRLSALCEQLEQGASQTGFSRPEALLSDLDEEFVKVRYALKAELQGAGQR